MNKLNARDHAAKWSVPVGMAAMSAEAAETLAAHHRPMMTAERSGTHALETRTSVPEINQLSAHADGPVQNMTAKIHRRSNALTDACSASDLRFQTSLERHLILTGSAERLVVITRRNTELLTRPTDLFSR